jgi:elongation factor P
MLSMTEIRKGKLIVLEGEPYQVMTSEYLRMQQRRPVMRTTLKHIRTGATKQHSFQQSDKVAEADVGRVPYQFLYLDQGTYTFMDQETFDQVELGVDIVGDAAPYLLEGQIVDMVLFDGEPIGIELPIKIDRKVIDAPPGVKGDTSSNVMKEVIVEGDLKIKAPLFIKTGDSIRIDTRSGDYVERA